MKKRNQLLRKKAFKRDNFTCQKCELQDRTSKNLEAHHTIPLFIAGKDEINNLITLCSVCHHYAPNKKEEFDEYIKDKCDGFLTTLIKAWQKVRQEHPELFELKK